MQGSLHIQRFQARHQVADAAGRQLALDAQARLLDGELEAALARVVAPDEVVLLKRLVARVRLNPRGSEREHARTWSDALALSLEQALRQTGSQELLRFANRQQALCAFVTDALQGESTHDWAWQQLALLSATRERISSAAQRRQALLRLLADDAQDSVPLLRSLLAGAHWPLLVAQLHDGELRGLTHAVLARLAGPSAAAFADLPAALDAAAPAMTDDDAAPAWYGPTLSAAASPARARWALRLATLLAAPGLARRGAAAVDRQLLAWSGTAPRSAATHALAQDGSTAALSAPGGRRDDRLARDAAHRPVGAAATPTTPETAPSRASGASGAPGTAFSAPQPSTAVARPDAAAAPPGLTAPVRAVEAIGRTRHGGLLLLPPLLPLCDALPLLEDAALWPGLPQALHQFALHLWPMAQDDPAALAFCGLAPLQPPPTRDGPAPALSQARQDALQRAQDLLLDHLAARLPDWRGPALLSRVLCRNARISADPGWIDVTFSLRDVAVELRRAALDLDPGFLPWLGVVLRYRYE